MAWGTRMIVYFQPKVYHALESKVSDDRSIRLPS